MFFRHAVLRAATMAIGMMILLGALLPANLGAQAQDAEEKWTFMVYMSGDSSLSDNVAADIQEMKQVGSSDKLDIIVLSDLSSYGDSGLARILPDGAQSLDLASIDQAWGSELDLGEPDTLSKFVIWAADAFRADRYMLDLWGHGNGWPGVCPDKGNSLEADELRTAMDAISGAGIHLDIISMDACQMGMIEIAYEVKGAADYALLSQKDVPLAGWPYDVFLRYLVGNGTVEEKAGAMIDGYINWGKVHSLYSLTLAFLDLSEMGNLTAALDTYADEAEGMAGYFNPEFVRARALTEEYDGNSEYDLVHLLQNIDAQTGCKALEVLGRDVAGAMDSVVVYESHWTNTIDEPAENAHGLSIWFPSYAPTIDYLKSSFGKETAWPGFIRAMSGHFLAPARTEAPYIAAAEPLDSDSDGLADSIRVDFPAQADGAAVIEVYGPDGGVFTSQNLPQAGGSMDIALGTLGVYQAAFYLRNSTGALLNYSEPGEVLAMEGLSVISGYVKSAAGRGLRWVNVNLVQDGEIVKSAVTDTYGHYRLEIVVPTDTNGTGLMLVCGLGTGQTNVTIGSLEPETSVDFIVETSTGHVAWFVRAIGLLNIGGIVLLVYWAAWGRERKPRKGHDELQYFKTSEPIPPQ